MGRELGPPLNYSTTTLAENLAWCFQQKAYQKFAKLTINGSIVKIIFLSDTTSLKHANALCSLDTTSTVAREQDI